MRKREDAILVWLGKIVLGAHRYIYIYILPWSILDRKRFGRLVGWLVIQPTTESEVDHCCTYGRERLSQCISTIYHRGNVNRIGGTHTQRCSIQL